MNKGKRKIYSGKQILITKDSLSSIDNLNQEEI